MILVVAINAICMSYSIRISYLDAKKQREKLKIQQAKIDKLSPP